jgi:hypothetical protein
MATTNVVPNPEELEIEEESQGRSTIRFPYLDQDDAVKFAKAIQATAGNSCTRDALAGYLKVSPKAGGFNLRAGTAKMFGLVDSDKGVFSLTELGKRAIDHKKEKAARAESFLLIPLYKRVFDEYRNQMLPGNQALEKAMEHMGVAPKQSDKARQAFQRSATQAGYFAFGNDRLIAPQSGSASSDPVPPNPQDLSKGGGGGGGDDGTQSLIDGLLKVLPKAGSSWPLEARKKWLQAAAVNFDYAYKSAEGEERFISVTIAKD